MKHFVSLLIFVFSLVCISSCVYASIGVGVGTGKIQVTQKLKPGIIYEFPPLTVVNTGTEQADYEVGVEYHKEQKEMMPSRDWFLFSPQKFNLEPGKVQVVNIKLNLPVRTQPGDYFAYLEGRPLKKTQTGVTSIGVAAASKLYFTVVPGSLWEGIYYKLASFWQLYTPWPQRASILIGLAVLFAIFKTFFNIEIARKPKHNDKEQKKK